MKASEPLVVMSGRAVAIVTGAIASVITARFLAPAGRGEYFLAITTAQLLAQFGNLGLPSANTYFVARDRRLAAPLFANSLWLAFVAVPLGAAAALWLLDPRVFGLTAGMRLTALTLAPLLVFTLLGSALLVGLGQVRAFSAIQALISASGLPFLAVAVWLGAGVRGFLLATIVGAIIPAAALWHRLRPRAEWGHLRIDTFASTFRYAVRAYVVTLASFLVLRINVFLLGALAGSAQVGYYSVASQIADTLAILPQSVAVVLFPRLAASTTGRLRTTLRHAAVGSAPLAAICLVMWVAATPLVAFAFGARFQPAVSVIHALLPGVFLVGIIAIVSQYLAASGFPSAMVASWIVAAAANAAIAAVLVPRYGAVGAGLSLSLIYGGLLVALVAISVRVEARAASASALAREAA